MNKAPARLGRLPGPLIVRLCLWLLVFAVFPLSVTTAALSFQVEVLGRTLRAPCVACSREPFVLKTESLSARVLRRLEVSEKKEVDPWLRDDIRIAWITVLYAARGNPEPHVDATRRVLGVHPSEVWPRIEARRRAQLGALYGVVWGEASSPRKPMQSVKLRAGSHRPSRAA